MNPKLIFLMLIIPYVSSFPQENAYPSPYSEEELIPPRREVYGSGRIYDITHRVTSGTLSGVSDEGIGEYLTLFQSMKNGSDYNFSIIKLPAHSGTHVDAPGHFYENYYQAGFDIDSLDLEVLNGSKLNSNPIICFLLFVYLYLITLVLLLSECIFFLLVH